MKEASSYPYDMGDGVVSPVAFPDGHFKPKAPEINAADLAKIGMVLKNGAVLNTISPVREFTSGATRDQDTTKFDFEGFLSPLALARFAVYMHKNRVQSDGSTRDSDNWQKGIPLPSYMKSLWRHLMTVWMHHRAVPAPDCEGMEDALCGVIFNAQGYLHEIMKAKEGE